MENDNESQARNFQRRINYFNKSEYIILSSGNLLNRREYLAMIAKVSLSWFGWKYCHYPRDMVDKPDIGKYIDAL